MALIVRPPPSDNTSCLGPLPPGDEERAQGGTELLRVETAELSRSQALVVPRAEHPAHDGPRRAVHTESGLAGKRGRELQGRCSGQRGQQLNRTEVAGGRPATGERFRGMDHMYLPIQ